MHGGMLGRNLQRLIGPSPKEKRRVRSLQRLRLHQCTDLVVLALMINRTVRGLKGFHDLNFLVHLLVAHFFGVRHTICPRIIIIDPGNQIDAEPPTR